MEERRGSPPHHACCRARGQASCEPPAPGQTPNGPRTHTGTLLGGHSGVLGPFGVSPGSGQAIRSCASRRVKTERGGAGGAQPHPSGPLSMRGLPRGRQSRGLALTPWDSPCCRASQSQTLPGVSCSTSRARGRVPVLGLREALMLLLLLAQDPIARTRVSPRCPELSLAPVCGRTRCWLTVPGGRF